MRHSKVELFMELFYARGSAVCEELRTLMLEVFGPGSPTTKDELTPKMELFIDKIIQITILNVAKENFEGFMNEHMKEMENPNEA